MITIAAAWFVTPSCAQEPPRPASFTVVDSARPSNDELRRYIADLRFLSDHVSSDQRIIDPAHRNWIVRAEPEARSHVGDGSQLRERGRILSRVVNLGTESIPRFALAPKGKTYFWVQNVGGVLRGVLISTDSMGAIIRREPIRVTVDSVDHPPHPVTMALARLRMEGATGGKDALTATVAAQCVPGCPTGWCRGDSIRTAEWW
jgi:hypothetical protein